MKSSITAAFGLVFWLATQARPQWDPYVTDPPRYVPGAAVKAPSSTTTSRRIHVLAVADSNDKNVGEGVAIDVATVQATFQELVPNPAQLNLKTLMGDAVTKEEILRAIADFRPAYTDTVACFFSGHGGHNAEGHYLCLPGNLPDVARQLDMRPHPGRRYKAADRLSGHREDLTKHRE